LIEVVSSWPPKRGHRQNGRKEIKTIATGLKLPNGIALHNGALYIAEISKISKLDNVADML
jgi:hypothetical protein